MPNFLRDLDDIISLRQSFKSDTPMHRQPENSNSSGSPVAQSCAQAHSEPDHTPGPWDIRSLDMTDYAVVGPERKVCNVAFYSKPENKANARLISAAPDLLQAAKQAEEALHHMMSANGMEPHEHECYTDLKAALAKAEGEA